LNRPDEIRADESRAARYENGRSSVPHWRICRLSAVP
jgi:hypothetical protein